jgi:DNA-binding NarL/FixJ family response regulator
MQGGVRKKMITLVIADDHPITRTGIREILSKTDDIQIVGEAQDGFEAQKLVAQLLPQVLLLDLKMPGPRPAEIEKWVRTHYPQTNTLVLTAHDRDIYLASMIDAGAAGYLKKNETSDRLVSAIRRVAGGNFLFTYDQLSRARRWQEGVGKKWKDLTPREREILLILAQGFDNVRIANMLNVTAKTVAFHITNILGKLELNSRQEVMAWVQKNLSDDDE